MLAVVAVLVHRQAFAKETTEYHDRAGGTQVSGQISELLVDFTTR